MQTNEVVVDVSTVIPRERHPKVFNTWHSLAESELHADGSYRIEFTPAGPVLSGEAAVGAGGCGGH